MSEPDDAGYAAWWLQLVLGDLATAAAVPARSAAGLAQQAVEEALKAAIALGATEPPRTHDLVMLARLLPESLGDQARSVDLPALSDALMSARYPDPLEPPYERPEAERLVEDPRALVRAVTACLAAAGVGVSALARAAVVGTRRG